MVHYNLVHYIYSYLEKRKQCVHINSATSSFKNNLSGVAQSSILGPTLFNLFFNDFFFCILIASAHNFGDDNSLSTFAATVEDLIELLQSECNVAIEWFFEKKIFVKTDSIQSLSISWIALVLK